MRAPRTGTCLTCRHPDRARIDLMLANGVSTRQVGAQFGLSHDSVGRHARNHVSADQKAKLRLAGLSNPKCDLETLKRSESEGLLASLIGERVRLQRIADRAEGVGNLRDATRASAEIVRVLELVAKYLGELRLGSTTINQNVLLSPDWFLLRRLITTALRPYPEAQRAVLAALREHELQRGADVTDRRALELPAPLRDQDASCAN